MATNKKVSIIIPCYKQAQFLIETLESVLSQTYPHWECIIVNDGSPDNTEEIAQRYCELDNRFIYLAKTNSGLADTRNFGIKHSQGEYILPLDSDDKIGATYLEKAIKYFDLHPNTKLVYCEAELFGERSGKWNLPKYDYDSLLKENIIFCSCIYKRVDYNNTDGYNPNMKYGLEDWDFLLSLLNSDSIVHRINEVLFFYRIKQSSMSADMKERYYDMRAQVIFNHPKKYLHMISNYIQYVNGIDYKIEYKKIKDSYAYRIGKIILTPFSFIRQKLTK